MRPAATVARACRADQWREKAGLLSVVVAFLPAAVLLRCVQDFVNWPAMVATTLYSVATAVVWEATLALPRQWWGYKPDHLLGITIPDWTRDPVRWPFPLEAAAVWVCAPLACVLVYEFSTTREYARRRPPSVPAASQCLGARAQGEPRYPEASPVALLGRYPQEVSMRSSLPALVAAVAFVFTPAMRADEAPASPAPPPPAHVHVDHAAAAHDPHASHFGSGGHPAHPEDLAGYIASQEEPGRAEWQKPDQVLEALGLAPGQTACDIGAGPGYFTLRLARALSAGHVYAVDVEPRMLDALRERLEHEGLRNVTPVLALGGDPLLPDGVCDLVLIVDTFHHFDDGAAYLRRLQRALRPGGRVANIDFHKRETPHGPPVAHRISRDAFLDTVAMAGYTVAQEHDFLPYQYFVVLRPR